jgi:nucleotide-binding universal stress UspA family protein
MPARASQPLSAQIGKGAPGGGAVDDIAWRDGDVLGVGSSSLEPVSREFLGSRATKILASPRCP